MPDGRSVQEEELDQSSDFPGVRVRGHQRRLAMFDFVRTQAKTSARSGKVG